VGGRCRADGVVFGGCWFVENVLVIPKPSTYAGYPVIATISRGWAAFVEHAWNIDWRLRGVGAWNSLGR